MAEHPNIQLFHNEGIATTDKTWQGWHMSFAGLNILYIHYKAAFISYPQEYICK